MGTGSLLWSILNLPEDCCKHCTLLSASFEDPSGLEMRWCRFAGVQPVLADQQEAVRGPAVDEAREVGQDGHQGRCSFEFSTAQTFIYCKRNGIGTTSIMVGKKLSLGTWERCNPWLCAILDSHSPILGAAVHTVCQH